MIKRRFFKEDHGDNSGGESSSSSDSEEEMGAEEEERFDESDEEQPPIGVEKEPQSGSGYESEDSSVNEFEEEEDPSGLSIDDDGEISEPVLVSSKINKQDAATEAMKVGEASTKKVAIDMDHRTEADFSNYILKHKSVFKCKLCPRIVCLSEDTVRTHLNSKRHARSKKLLVEGRLKLMLNSDGETEEEQETHAERHARTIALSKEAQAKKKDSGRQRQSRRKKKKQQRQSGKSKVVNSKEKPNKKLKTEK